MRPALGIMFRCQYPPEQLVAFARQAEAAGFDTVWVVEDCFFNGGVSAAAVALASTERIQVGLGILPAVSRNAAYMAMEIATLARQFPGRFLPGIGHGLSSWLHQVGAAPRSPLGALEEKAQAVRALLHGETVTTHGEYVQLEAVTLNFPPQVVPPLSLGVMNAKSLQVAGRVADGTILAEMASPAYVRWARAQIAQGMAEAGKDAAPHDAAHRVTVYTHASTDGDREAARDRIRPALVQGLHWASTQLNALGLGEQAQALLAGGDEAAAHALPDSWIDLLGLAGTGDDFARGIAALGEAGADEVVFVPPLGWDDPIGDYARHVLPALR